MCDTGTMTGGEDDPEGSEVCVRASEGRWIGEWGGGQTSNQIGAQQRAEEGIPADEWGGDPSESRGCCQDTLETL
jgi:hypothetical protein